MTGFVTLWLSWWGLAALVTVMAGVLHEIAHAAAARLLGGRVAGAGLNRLLFIYVDWQPPDDATVLDVHLVQLAPALVGWAVGLVWLARYGWPSLSPASILGAWGWFIFTIGGGLSDYSLARSAAPGEQRIEEASTQA